MLLLNRYYRFGRVLAGYWLRKSIVSYRPVKLWIESTNHCNLKCVMCPNHLDKNFEKGFMDVGLFKKIIDEASGAVHSVTLHHRGEPLLHRYLDEMIRYCRQRGILTQIHTNGTLLTERKSREIIESGLNLISFSMDGYNKKSYEAIRVGANFEKTVENIKKFIEIRNKTGLKKPQVVLECINFFRDDPKKSEKLEQWTNTLNVDKLIIKNPHNWAGSYASGKRTQRQSNRRPIWPDCTFPWYALTIFWDGTAVACPQDFYGKTAIGNLNDATLRQIWNHPLQIQRRDQMKRGQMPIDPCRTCDRIGRKKVIGIPVEPLSGFLKEMM